MENVPDAKHDLEGSVVVRPPTRQSWFVTEMLLLCNEAARRGAKRGAVMCKKDANGVQSKPLGLEYMVDRITMDDPLSGYMIRTEQEGWLQGFVTVTTFMTWLKNFEWDSLSRHNGISDDDRKHHAWDFDGSLASALNSPFHALQPHPSRDNAFISPRVAEISLLGGLGCGAKLLQLVLDDLAQNDEYDFVVLQATDNAVKFYEKMGFVRVGAIAQRVEDSNNAIKSAAEAHVEQTSGRTRQAKRADNDTWRVWCQMMLGRVLAMPDAALAMHACAAPLKLQGQRCVDLAGVADALRELDEDEEHLYDAVNRGFWTKDLDARQNPFAWMRRMQLPRYANVQEFCLDMRLVLEAMVRDPNTAMEVKQAAANLFQAFRQHWSELGSKRPLHAQMAHSGNQTLATTISEDTSDTSGARFFIVVDWEWAFHRGFRLFQVFDEQGEPGKGISSTVSVREWNITSEFSSTEGRYPNDIVFMAHADEPIDRDWKPRLDIFGLLCDSYIEVPVCRFFQSKQGQEIELLRIQDQAEMVTAAYTKLCALRSFMNVVPSIASSQRLPVVTGQVSATQYDSLTKPSNSTVRRGVGPVGPQRVGASYRCGVCGQLKRGHKCPGPSNTWALLKKSGGDVRPEFQLSSVPFVSTSQGLPGHEILASTPAPSLERFKPPGAPIPVITTSCPATIRDNNTFIASETTPAAAAKSSEDSPAKVLPGSECDGQQAAGESDGKRPSQCLVVEEGLETNAIEFPAEKMQTDFGQDFTKLKTRGEGVEEDDATGKTTEAEKDKASADTSPEEGLPCSNPEPVNHDVKIKKAEDSSPKQVDENREGKELLESRVDEEAQDKEESEEEEMSEYELKRLQRMEENKRLMLATGILQATRDIEKVKQGDKDDEKKRKMEKKQREKPQVNPEQLRKLRARVSKPVKSYNDDVDNDPFEEGMEREVKNAVKMLYKQPEGDGHSGARMEEKTAPADRPIENSNIASVEERRQKLKQALKMCQNAKKALELFRAGKDFSRPFNWFVKQVSARIRIKYPELHQKQIMKIAGNIWKTLPSEDKDRWDLEQTCSLNQVSSLPAFALELLEKALQQPDFVKDCLAEMEKARELRVAAQALKFDRQSQGPELPRTYGRGIIAGPYGPEMSPYQLFVKAMTAKLKVDNPSCNQNDRIKQIAQMWQAMSKNERQSFHASSPRQSPAYGHGASGNMSNDTRSASSSLAGRGVLDFRGALLHSAVVAAAAPTQHKFRWQESETLQPQVHPMLALLTPIATRNPVPNYVPVTSVQTPESPSTYTTQLDGEMVTEIASRWGVSLDLLVEMNKHSVPGITQKSLLKKDTLLNLPRPGQVTLDKFYKGWRPYYHWTYPDQNVSELFPSIMMVKRIDRDRSASQQVSSIGRMRTRLVDVPPPMLSSEEVRQLNVLRQSEEQRSTAAKKAGNISCIDWPIHPEEGPGWIVCKGGEKISDIALGYGLSLQIMIAINKDRLPGLSRSCMLKSGTMLRLPGPTLCDDDINWFELCIKMIHELAGAKSESGRDLSWPFLEKVDWIKLNMPEYCFVVNQPMDLHTVDTRLCDGMYKDADGFSRDVRLVFENALAFNDPQDAVHGLALKMLEIMEQIWSRHGVSPPTIPVLLQGATNGGSGKKSVFNTPQKRTEMFNKVVTVEGHEADSAYYFVLHYVPDLHWCHLAPMREAGVFPKLKKSGEPHPHAGKKRWRLVPEGESKELDVSAERCIIVRSKTVVNCSDADKELWVIHDTRSDTGQERELKRNGKTKELLAVRQELEDNDSHHAWVDACERILTKLMRHEHAWPFCEAVDPDQLGLPDYFEIIKTPMDLSEVRRRLQTQEYSHVDEFMRDVSLTFDNAIAYNPEDNFVWKHATNMKRIWEGVQRNTRILSRTLQGDSLGSGASKAQSSTQRTNRSIDAHAEAPKRTLMFDSFRRHRPTSTMRVSEQTRERKQNIHAIGDKNGKVRGADCSGRTAGNSTRNGSAARDARHALRNNKWEPVRAPKRRLDTDERGRSVMPALKRPHLVCGTKY